MNEPLNQAFCEPCSLGTLPLLGEELDEMMKEIANDWQLINDMLITKAFKFKDFKKALEFVNRVGEIAEEQGHHPDIELGWGKVVIKLMTHKIKGLSKNDFIMAARIDLLN
ncbi:MAG TPA: 4a-hydroxytetrahydrobiopterin dehydratase [Clostridiales bacterium UBA8960]|nr:4a-hydroxytetrahydrobiopterin dehydratase [Clostridiales bacterium UBA8960]